MSDRPPSAPEDRPFEPIEDRREALQFLEESCKTYASVMCWTKNQESVIHGNLQKFTPSKRTFYLWPNANFDPSEFDMALRAKRIEHCLFSVSLMRASIFFKAKYLAQDKDGLLFEFPEMIYKVQRRKDMRVPVRTMGLVVHIQGTPRKVLDLSAGGLAFEIPESEAAAHKTGLALDSVEFTLNGRLIQAVAVVRHGTKTRIGAQFIALRPADAQLISGFVFQESRKLMSKLL